MSSSSTAGTRREHSPSAEDAQPASGGCSQMPSRTIVTTHGESTPSHLHTAAADVTISPTSSTTMDPNTPQAVTTTTPSTPNTPVTFPYPVDILEHGIQQSHNTQSMFHDPLLGRGLAIAAEASENAKDLEPRTTFKDDIQAGADVKVKRESGHLWSPPKDMGAVEEGSHAAVMQVVSHPTDPSGKPLNILEPLADTFALTSGLSVKPNNNLNTNIIRSPRYIQSYGCLVICSIQTGIVSHCSESVKPVLGIEPSNILSHHIQAIIPEEKFTELLHGTLAAESMMHHSVTPNGECRTEVKEDKEEIEVPPSEPTSPTARLYESGEESVVKRVEAMKLGNFPNHELNGVHFMLPVEIAGHPMAVIAHKPAGSEILVLDIVPTRPPRFSAHDLGVRLNEFHEGLGEANNIYRGAQLAVDSINKVLGYDRSVVYRLIPPDYHAEVIAEERMLTDLYPFLGLKFPAVAPAERERFVELSARVIDDTTSTPSLIIGSFNHLLKPRTVVSPKGTTTTIFTTPSPKTPANAGAGPEPLAPLPEYEPSSRAISTPRETSTGTPTTSSGGDGTSIGSTIVSGVKQVASSILSTVLASGQNVSPGSPGISLSLNHSLLRMPNQTHLNVLRSLGIRSVMCQSIAINRQLFGVIAFYSVNQPTVYSTRTTHNACIRQTFCWEEYQFLRGASIIFANWIRKQERKTKILQQDQLRDMSARLKQSLDRRLQNDPKGIINNIVFGHPDLCEIAGSDTFAFCCGENWLRVGSLCAQSWLQAFLDWIIRTADDQRDSTGVTGWTVFKIWSSINLSRDYPGPTPDPRLAAGALVIVLKDEPRTAFLCFRVETKSSEVWDGTETAGVHTTTENSPPGRTIPSTAGALTVAEITAKSSTSPYAQQFLRAFHIATHSSCAPWPVNAFPLLKVICDSLSEYATKHGWEAFITSNLSSLVSNCDPENTLPSRLLREELDGLLLLRREAERSQPILGQSTPEEERGGLHAQSGHDRVLCVNQGWCEIFGFVDETAELKDHDIERSLSTAGVPLNEVMHPLFDTTRTITVWSRKKGHTTLSFKCFHVYSVLLDGKFHEVIAFTFDDITLQQRVEQALLLAHQQSRRSELAKQRMIGMVSHELRTPLTAILGFSEILANDLRLTHEQREYLADIHSAGSHLLNIITNLLDLTKFELSDSKKQLVDVVEIVKEAALWLKKTLANKLLTLHLRLPSESGELVDGSNERLEEFVESPIDYMGESIATGASGGSASLIKPSLATVESKTGKNLTHQFKDAKLLKLYTLGDSVSLKRVIINLLDNSAKFTLKLGSITVTVRSLPPLIPTHHGFIEISVRDTGIGMSPTILDKIWEPFYQADLSAQRELGGAGLGLAMVKSIVELHDGSVSVESEVGTGSKFTIGLPLVKQATSTGSPISPTVSVTSGLPHFLGALSSPKSSTSSGSGGEPTRLSPTESLLKLQFQRAFRDTPSPPKSPPGTIGLASGLGSSTMLPSAESEMTPVRHHQKRHGIHIKDPLQPQTPTKRPTTISEATPTTSPSTPTAAPVDSLRQRMEQCRLTTKPTVLHSPRIGSRTIALGPSSRALPGLSFSSQVMDDITLSDEEEDEAKKLGRYASMEPCIQPKQPPEVRMSPTGEKILVPREFSTDILSKPQLRSSTDTLSTVEQAISSAITNAASAAVGALSTSVSTIASAAAPTLVPSSSSTTASTSTASTKSKSRHHTLPVPQTVKTYPDIKILVVDDSEINKKLFCRLLAMEGFTNVETAAHGLEAVELLIMWRDQSIIQWKKSLEIQQTGTIISELTANQEKAWEIERAQSNAGETSLTAEEADDIRHRATMEAQEVAKNLLSQLGVLESSHTTAPQMNEHERQTLMRHAVNEIIAKEKSTKLQHHIEQRLIPEDTIIGRSPVTDRPIIKAADPVPRIVIPFHASALLPKLIFLDLHMPYLDGFQTALAVRKLGFDMPIAALTASVGTADQAMAEQLGFQRYLTKPIQRKELREVLDLAIRQAEKDRRGQAEPSKKSPTYRTPIMAEVGMRIKEHRLHQQQLEQQQQLQPSSQQATSPHSTQLESAAAPITESSSSAVKVEPRRSSPPLFDPADLPPSMGLISPSPSPPPSAA